MNRLSAASVALVILLSACRDTPPTAPQLAGEEPGSEIMFNVIGTSVTTMGWLAPLGSTSTSAPQSSDLRPVVTICRWNKTVCVGTPVARFEVGTGLSATDAGFAASWSLTAPGMPLSRTTFRIAVTLNGAAVGLPILVDAMRGRWALSVPGQTPTLVAAASLPLQFRLGTPTEPPPPVATVTSGLASASTQFFPSASGETTRTTEQAASLTTLSTNLAAFQSALTGPPEVALLALSQASSAADFAFRIAPAGDKADLDVIRLELAQAGKLFGISN